MIGTVLAAGLDRWEKDGTRWRLKGEGPLWLMATCDKTLEPFVVLKPDVAQWCWENIGAYRIVERYSANEDGPLEDDCWWIEFKSDTDGVLFKMRWW
jgi:hypothetical protein